MAEHIEIARAFITIVPSMEGSQKTITQELTGVTQTAATEAGEKSGKSLGESLAKGLKTTAAVIGASMAAATAAAVATGKAFINAANGVSEYGNNIDKNSQKLGISAKSYQEWSFILEHAGANIDGMKTAMLKLTKAAEGGDDAFKELGISQEQLASMNQEETFSATIKALQDVQDESKRTVLASKLLGKGATELAPLFNMTSGETESLRQQVHDLGGIMSDEAVKAAANYQDELQNMNTALTGVKNNMMAQFLPGISSVMNGLSKVFSNNGGIEEIRNGLQNIVGKITALAPQFFDIASVLVNSLIDGFGPMIPSIVTSVFSFLNQAIVTVTAMIPQLTPAITEGIKGIATAVFQSLPVIVSALVDMSKELVTWLASGDNVKTLVDGILGLVSTLAENLADALPIILPAVVNIISQVAQSLTDPKNVEMVVKSTLYVVGAVVVALAKALPEIGGLIVKTTVNIFNQVKTFGGQLVSRIGSWFGSLWSNVTGWLGSFISNVISKIQTLPQQAVTIGKNLIQGLINGVKSMASKAIDTVKGLGKSVVSGLKGILGIHSPSKVFEQIGQFTAEGFAIGYSETMQDVQSDMAASMQGLTANMSATVSAYGTADGIAGDTTNYNGGNITLNIYGAEGQNVNDLAEIIAVKLQEMTNRRAAVYA